jgi:protein-disulfide isomerase
MGLFGKIGGVVLAALLGQGVPAWGEGADGQAAPLARIDPASVPALADFLKIGARLVAEPPVGDGGLIPWAAEKDGKLQVVYTTLDGRNLVVGAVYDATGKSLTADHLREAQALMAPALVARQGEEAPLESEEVVDDQTPAAKMMAELERASWFEMGPREAPMLYVVVDAQCPACHAFLKILDERFIREGLVRVRIVPAAVLGNERSSALDANLLSAADPAAAWRAHMSGNDSMIAGVPQDDAAKRVRANTALFFRWHMKGTPFSVYRAGGRLSAIYGVPADIPGVVGSLSKP